MKVVKAKETVNKQIKILIYGNSGTQKTRFATFGTENAVIGSLENGLGSIENKDIDTVEIKDAAQYREFLEWIQEQNYDSVVIDSLTEYSSKLMNTLNQMFPEKSDSFTKFGMLDTTL